MNVRIAAGIVGAAVGACGAVEGTWVIDRIEEGRAVLVSDRGDSRSVARRELPAGAREGDVLVAGRIDATERARRERAIEDLRGRLRARIPPPSGGR